MASLASLPPWKITGGCLCPDDCRCRRETDPPCGCQQHAPDHPWTVTLGNGDWSEADTLDAALTAAHTMIDDAVRDGASHLLTRQAITLYRDGMRHGIGTMLAREGFLKNPLQLHRTEDA